MAVSEDVYMDNFVNIESLSSHMYSGIIFKSNEYVCIRDQTLEQDHTVAPFYRYWYMYICTLSSIYPSSPTEKHVSLCGP